MQITTSSPSPRPIPVSDLLGEPQRFLDVGHSRLAYWSMGQGPDVLFVHGWPLHSGTFRRIAPPLSAEFRCHFVDLPGAGRTVSDPDAPIGIAENARTLARVVDLLGLSRFALLAHDSGAAFARYIAHDPRVSALVLGNTEIPGHRSMVLEAYIAFSKLPGSLGLIRRAMRSRTVRASALGFGGCFEDPSYVEGEFFELFVKPLLDSKEALAGHARLLENLDFSVVDALTEQHRKIRAPVLLLWGEHDPFFPLPKARRMLSEFGGPAELSVIEGAKLFAHEDHAEEFARRALAFLRRTAS